MLLERGGKLETKPVSHHRSLFQLVCLLLPISSGHRCSRGGKIHGSRSRSPARISRQPDQPGPSQHTPLQGDSQQQSAPERTKSSTHKLKLYQTFLKSVVVEVEQVQSKIFFLTPKGNISFSNSKCSFLMFWLWLYKLSTS